VIISLQSATKDKRRGENAAPFLFYPNPNSCGICRSIAQ
jgi:hypothetical protein